MADANSEREHEEAAAAEAARIGGSPAEHQGAEGDNADEAQRPLEQAGQGEAEGFELAERDLIEHASHGDQHAARRAAEDAPSTSDDQRAARGGESDTEYSSEIPQDDH